MQVPSSIWRKAAASPLGAPIPEVVLTVPEEQLRNRIDEDRTETKAHRWRQEHVTPALTAFASLTDAHFVDASQPPEQVADAVASHVRHQP